MEIGSPITIVLSSVELARLPGADPEAALTALEEHGGHVRHADRMDARFRLWELTGNRTHLDEAHRLLEHLRDHAPEEARVSMIENVPLHFAIMRAWED